MHNKSDSFTYTQRFEQRFKVAAMLNEGIGARAAVGQLLRIAHADEIRGKNAAKPLHVRNNIAPDVGEGGIAVQEDNRITLALVHIRHLQSLNKFPLFL